MDKGKMKPLEFAVYYDITDFAHKHSKPHKEYSKIFVCSDTWDFWLCRIAEGCRFDEDEGYVEEDGGMILERNKIAKDYKGQALNTENDIKILLNEDYFGNWDCMNVSSVEHAIEKLDAGYGIKTLEYNE